MTSRAELSVRVTVNGEVTVTMVEPRYLLSDFLRNKLGLTGTRVGCEHGVCGACTVLIDDHAARSCLMFAVQADECSITTIEGLSSEANGLHPLQSAFRDNHAIQCGFCTSGMLMVAAELLRENPSPSRDEIREAISGNLCRCTGYTQIIDAIAQAAHHRRYTEKGANEHE